MSVRKNFSRGGQSRHFAYLFLGVDNATQIDVYKKRKNSSGKIKRSSGVIPVLRQQLHTMLSL